MPGELLWCIRRQKCARMRPGRPERACGDDQARCPLTRAELQESAILGAIWVAERCWLLRGFMLDVHDDLCCPSTCVWKLQHSHHGCATANMNQGGAPKGTRKATLLAEQNNRERADPSLKKKREQEEKAVRNSFSNAGRDTEVCLNSRLRTSTIA